MLVYYSFMASNGSCVNLCTLTKMMLVFLCLLRSVRVNIYTEYRENGQAFTGLNYRYSIAKCVRSVYEVLDTCVDRHREVPEVLRA